MKPDATTETTAAETATPGATAVIEEPKRKEKPTRLFLSYVLRLLFRLTLLAIAVWLFATDPDALSASERFGIASGFDFVDFVFLAIAWDFLTKFLVRARISAGSLKQYRIYHIPTPATLDGDREAFRSFLVDVGKRGHDLIAEGRTALSETYEGIMLRGGNLVVFARRLLNDIDFLNLLHFKEESLTVDRSLRSVLYRDRTKEIVPVIVFWIVVNALFAMVLLHFDVLNERTALLWSMGYFLSDMVCVVLWCPLQLALMRNRCCTTCQIFNWDAIMVATPLVFVGGWFGWTLILLALVVLVRWELAAIRHPERFDERTNARLSCAQCQDKLCYLRRPLTRDEGRIDLVALMKAEDDAREGAPEEPTRKEDRT